MIKQSTPQTPKEKDPRCILLVGPPGGSKTTIAMQFPSPCFIDLDTNLDGPEHHVRSKNKDLSYSYINPLLDKEGKKLPDHATFDAICLAVDEVRDDKNSKTGILDGMTSSVFFNIEKTLKQQGRSGMEARDWGTYNKLFWHLLKSRIPATRKTFIVTCHERTKTKPNPSDMMNPTVVGYEPAIPGGIAEQFGHFFTDVWRVTAELGSGNKRFYRIQTSRDTFSDLKNSMGLPPVIDIQEGELAWTKLEPYLRGNL